MHSPFIFEAYGGKPSTLQRNAAIGRELHGIDPCQFEADLTELLLEAELRPMPAVAFAAGVGGGLAETDALAPARGIKNGLGFSVVLYAIIIVLAVLVGKNFVAAVEQERLSSQENFSSYRTAGVAEAGR